MNKLQTFLKIANSEPIYSDDLCNIAILAGVCYKGFITLCKTNTKQASHILANLLKDELSNLTGDLPTYLQLEVSKFQRGHSTELYELAELLGVVLPVLEPSSN